jgi:hypothetical protein
MIRSDLIPLAAVGPARRPPMLNAHPVAVYLARLAPNTRVLATTRTWDLNFGEDQRPRAVV